MSTSPAVAKTVWTQADFDAMSWHDNAVHAVALEPVPDHPGRLLLDLDYILEWVPAEPPASTLSFWICPATLVFDQAWDLTADIDLRGHVPRCGVNDLHRGLVSGASSDYAVSRAGVATSFGLAAVAASRAMEPSDR